MTPPPAETTSHYHAGQDKKEETLSRDKGQAANSKLFDDGAQERITAQIICRSRPLA
jgi:hypothetical protein